MFKAILAISCATLIFQACKTLDKPQKESSEVKKHTPQIKNKSKTRRTSNNTIKVSPYAFKEYFTISNNWYFEGSFNANLSVAPSDNQNLIDVTVSEAYFESQQLDFEKIIFFKVDTTTETLYLNPEYFVQLNRQNAIFIDSRILPLGEFTYKKHNLRYRDFAFLLMYAEVIQTYMHLYATVELVHEDIGADTYKAYFNATHHYCTNDCSQKDYGFGFEINKSTVSLFNWDVRPAKD